MSVNAYSRGPVAPGFSNPYVSQYVEAPLGYIGAALQQRQATYDHIQEGLNGLGETFMGAQGVSPADAAYVQKAQAQYKKQLEAFADQDLTTPGVQRQMKEFASQLAGDTTLQNIKQNYAAWGNAMAQGRKLKADGKYHAASGQLLNQALAAYDQAGGAAGGARLDLSDLEPEVNSREIADGYFKALHASQQEGLGFLDVGEDGKVAYSNKYGGIGRGKVDETVMGAAQDFLASSAGRQVMNDARAQGATSQEAARYALQYLRNRGMAHTYSDSSSNLDVAYNKVGDLKRAKSKEKKEALPTWLSGPQMKPELGKRPSFDREGNIIDNPGMIESFGAGWGAGADANLPYTARALMALHGSYKSLFGDTSEKKGLDDLIGRKTSDLQKGLEIRNRAAASMGRPTVSGEDFYHTRNVWQPTMMPVPTSSKALNDAQAVKNSLTGMTLYDEQGPHHYNDYIQEGDQVQINSDPYTAWPTKYSNHTIGATITSKDGKQKKVYFDAGSQYDYMDVPRTKEDVQAKNTRLLNKAKHHGYARGIEWRWDDKEKKAIPVGEKEGTYDPNLSTQPLFTSVPQ